MCSVNSGPRKPSEKVDSGKRSALCDSGQQRGPENGTKNSKIRQDASAPRVRRFYYRRTRVYETTIGRDVTIGKQEERALTRWPVTTTTTAAVAVAAAHLKTPHGHSVASSARTTFAASEP